MYVKHQNKTAGIVQMAHFIINVSRMCKHEIPNKNNRPFCWSAQLSRGYNKWGCDPTGTVQMSPTQWCATLLSAT